MDSKYADKFSFDVMEMQPPFSPDRFIAAIKDAQQVGYGTLVLDSLSHAWNGTGGLLEIVDQIAARSSSKNTFAAWKEGTPIYNKLIDAIIQSNINIIATMRTKQDYVLEADERGKQKPVKIGMNPIQRDGFEYEFDVVLTMDIENQGIVTKTRCEDLAGGVFKKPGKQVADILTNWLQGAPKVEITDVLSTKAVEYAAKQWNISPNEATEEIKSAIANGKLEQNTPKETFKSFVSGLNNN